MPREVIVACDPNSCRRRIALARFARLTAACVLAGLLFASTAPAQILRVVTYNIDADTGGADGALGGVYAGPGLTTVLKAIGSEHLNGNAQPIDVLALQELNYSRTTTTLDFIINQLNSIYGAGTYAYDTTLDPTTGDFTGNGPSGLVYNTHTVQVLTGTLAPKVIGSPSGSGAPRAPIRYTLAPKGYNDHSADFTIYVSHMKSGSPGSGPGSNGDRRNIEAGELRDDAYALNDSLNGATSAEIAHIIYTGDYNMDGSSEAGYQTMISSSVHSGIMKASDTLNPANNWDTSSTYKGLFTESATYVQYRDDVQYVSGPMTNQAGIQLVPNTLIAFGNGGGVYHNPVTDSSNSAALTDLTPSSYRTSVLNALTTATDHLPVVADYSFATAVGAPGDYDHSGVVDAADYNLWRSTFGTTGSNLHADGNHNGVVDGADYLIWRRYRTSGSGAGVELVNAIPEPSSLALAVIGICLVGGRRAKLKPWIRES
jgi:hypothetical protein